MRTPAILLAASIVAVAPALSARANPVLQIVSQSVTLDFADHQADFEVVFNRAPDFHTMDSSGRQADSFWFDLDTDDHASTGTYAYWYTPTLGIDRRIISEGGLSTLTLHDQSYGPTMSSIPFDLEGNTLRFMAGFALLGIPQGIAQLEYALTVAQYGATTDQVVVVPLPRSLATAGPLLLVLAVAHGAARKRHRV